MKGRFEKSATKICKHVLVYYITHVYIYTYKDIVKSKRQVDYPSPTESILGNMNKCIDIYYHLLVLWRDK